MIIPTAAAVCALAVVTSFQHVGYMKRKDMKRYLGTRKC
jgi:hypothetical protein